jgi:flagellar L-ring protein precursor FlgH
MIVLRALLTGVVLASMLSACATADRTPLVAEPTSAKPRPGVNVPSSVGSLFPTSGSGTGNYRPLFEDRRARAIGDTLTVALNERTSASRKSGATTERKGSADAAIDSAGNAPFAKALQNIGISGSGNLKTEGKGSSIASNDFSGTITVTVLDVLPNGNLRVSGEKQLAVSADEEIIRFSGIVNPSDLNNNIVLSGQVADARIEYRGRGAGDDAQSPGWLTTFLLKASPF